MSYTKYYTLETQDGNELLSCNALENSNALNWLRAERDDVDNNIPSDGIIYSYDIDEFHSNTALRLINKTLVE